MATPTESSSRGPHNAAYAGSWQLDPSATTVALKTKAMFGLLPVKGTFQEVRGTATVGPGGEVDATIVVDASSLSTKIKKRDEHLRSADFFDVSTHPSITVTIDGIDDALTATGALTVKGKSLPMSFPLTVTESNDDHITLDTTFDVDRSSYGLTFSKQGATKMHNTITVHATFVRT